MDLRGENVWGCAQVVDGLFIWLLSRPLGVVRIRWGFAAEAGVDVAAVVEVFDPGGDPGVDLFAGGEGIPVIVVGCEGGPQGFSHGVIPADFGPTPSTQSLARRACSTSLARNAGR